MCLLVCLCACLLYICISDKSVAVRGCKTDSHTTTGSSHTSSNAAKPRSDDPSCLSTTDMSVAVRRCITDSHTTIESSLVVKPKSVVPFCLSTTDMSVGVTGCTANSHSPPAVDGAAGGGIDGHLSLPAAGPLPAG